LLKNDSDHSSFSTYYMSEHTVASWKQSANFVAASWSLHEMIVSLSQKKEMIVSDKEKWVSKLYNIYKLFT
jgi:hypothetical protein